MKTKILIKTIAVSSVFPAIPVFVDIPANTKSIEGILVTTSLDTKYLSTNELLGRVKILTDVYKKTDLPDFDVYAKTKKWNKNLFPVNADINQINRQLKLVYQPMRVVNGKPLNQDYTVKIYLKCLLSNEC